MEISKMYSKRVGKVFKSNHDKDVSVFKNEFLPIFTDCFRNLPEDVTIEMFHKFVTHSDREYKDALYNLVNIFELFEENYDIDVDPFTTEEWEYLKLIVNDCTDEIGLETVKYIMQTMLDLDYM